MTKRIVSQATLFAALLVAGALLMMATALPALAVDSATLGAAQLQATSEDVPLQAAKTVEVDQYVYDDNSTYHQGKGVSWVYDVSGIDSTYYYGVENHKVVITSAKGPGRITYERVKGHPGYYTIKATKAGKVTVTCKESWTEEVGDYDEDGDWVYKDKKYSKLHKFVIGVVSLKNLSGTVSKMSTETNPYSYSYTNFTFKIKGLYEDADVSLVKDSNKNGYSYVSNVAEGKVTLSVSGVGTHIVKLKAYGRTFKVKAVLRGLSLKKTDAVKDTGGLTMKVGLKRVLEAKVTGIKSPKVKWSSTDTKIATVNKGGKVKAKKVGRCYIKAKYGKATLKVLVEVTKPGAYEAVQNALYDLHQPIVYSQATRMSPGYRDCSSFVSRCYWDNTQGRYIMAIGGEGAKTWAATAAGQAWWLANYKTTVSWGPCKVSKLRPGDTIYFKTGYAGTNTEWLSIDHAAMYVGNGRVVQTHSGSGKGDVGISSYWPDDDSIVIICRPIP